MKRLTLLLGIALLSLFSFSQNSTTEHHQQKLQELNAELIKNAGNIFLYYARADIYDELNDFAKANSDYKKVLELYQKKPDQKYAGEYFKSCYRLADDYYFRNSNREKALKYAADGLKTASNFKDLEILEAILLGFDPAKQEVALGKYKALSAKYPDDVRLSIYHAKFLKNSDPLAAAGLYEKVVAADPFNREALVAIGTIYNNEATRLSESVITDPEKIYDYAMKAVQSFERLHKLNPSDKEITNVLLRLYDELNEQGKAKQLNANIPY